jgi:hypothetical protein
MGSLLAIYIYNRVPKWHYVVGLLELYDLHPTYGFYVSALDRGHQSFEQSDWPSRSRDGISLYRGLTIEFIQSLKRLHKGHTNIKLY